MDNAEKTPQTGNTQLSNPLEGFTHDELRQKGMQYARSHALIDPEDVRAFELGAILAQDPTQYAACPDLTESELAVLEKEFTSRWSQPGLLYLVIVLCSTCAAVQGMG